MPLYRGGLTLDFGLPWEKLIGVSLAPLLVHQRGDWVIQLCSGRIDGRHQCHGFKRMPSKAKQLLMGCCKVRAMMQKCGGRQW